MRNINVILRKIKYALRQPLQGAGRNGILSTLARGNWRKGISRNATGTASCLQWETKFTRLELIFEQGVCGVSKWRQDQQDP